MHFFHSFLAVCENFEFRRVCVCPCVAQWLGLRIEYGIAIYDFIMASGLTLLLIDDKPQQHQTIFTLMEFGFYFSGFANRSKWKSGFHRCGFGVFRTFLNVI